MLGSQSESNQEFHLVINTHELILGLLLKYLPKLSLFPDYKKYMFTVEK